jgi:hypothetical protein
MLKVTLREKKYRGSEMRASTNFQEILGPSEPWLPLGLVEAGERPCKSHPAATDRGVAEQGVDQMLAFACAPMLAETVRFVGNYCPGGGDGGFDPRVKLGKPNHKRKQ